MRLELQKLVPSSRLINVPPKKQQLINTKVPILENLEIYKI